MPLISLSPPSTCPSPPSPSWPAPSPGTRFAAAAAFCAAVPRSSISSSISRTIRPRSAACSCVAASCRFCAATFGSSRNLLFWLTLVRRRGVTPQLGPQPGLHLRLPRLRQLGIGRISPQLPRQPLLPLPLLQLRHLGGSGLPPQLGVELLLRQPLALRRHVGLRHIPPQTHGERRAHLRVARGFLLRVGRVAPECRAQPFLPPRRLRLLLSSVSRAA